MYVIKRTDQGGGYVSWPGSKNSYTHKLENACVWSTRTKAEASLCTENEIVLLITQIIQKPL